MRTIEALVAEIQARHFAYPPADAAGLDRIRALGLPEDALRFYGLCDGAWLHEATEAGGLGKKGDRWWQWHVIPSRELVFYPETGWIIADSPLLPHQRYWVPVVDVADGNYLSITTESGRVGEVIDCFHETLDVPGSNNIVALSFTEMLESLLSNRECFWLQEDRRRYGAY